MKTKFTLMALLLAGLTMPSLQAQETKTLKVLPVADTYVRENNTQNNGSKEDMELQGTGFMGLMRFDLSENQADLENYEITGAQLRLVTKTCKGDRAVKLFDYGNDFAENTTYANEQDYLTAALETPEIGSFSVLGLKDQSLGDDKTADWANYLTADKWTNYVDLTDYVCKKIEDGNSSFNILIQRPMTNTALKFATREATDITNAGTLSNGGTSFTFAKEDIVPQLTLTLTPKATDSPDIYLLCGENFYGWIEDLLTEEYKFSQDEDDPNIYVLDSCPIVEEDFYAINFKYGDQYLVPVGEDDDEIVTFTDNVYTSKFVISDDDSFGWTYNNWLGGEISVQLNFETMTIIIQRESEIEDIYYLRGPFNNYDPAGSETWALNPVENDNGVYYGEFEILAGEFEFNLLSPIGVMIPGEINSVEMSFDNNVFAGSMDLAYDDEEEAMTWSYPKWEGGVIAVTVDANAYDALTVKILDDYSAIKKIESVNGEDVIYNLQGVRVNNPVKGGIYVINGKKVILK